jgi:four helix bundle protein
MHWKDLEVWKLAHQLVLQIYKITAGFPKSEIYALSSQMKRAAYSVPANIVEGQSRKTTKEYIQFLHNARGSLEETRYFLLLAKDLDFIPTDIHQDLENRYEAASKMLNGLIRSLKEG